MGSVCASTPGGVYPSPRVFSAKADSLYLRKIEAEIRVNPMGVRL
jgi:hypothetical protein